ncbi:zinc-ribbon domain-containing protein [Streptomyces ossamyceticus]|uniref:Zinc-ribbon domain-containing protein n=1 Tax=Streptomyces ossamyceticus TaxID=249581 RepID=A0ABV2UX89_9ACTN
MTSYCPHCGTPGPDDARYCMKCGRERIPVPSAPPAPDASAGPGAPPTPPTAPPTGPASAPPGTPPPPPGPAAGVPPVGPPPPPEFAPVPARPSPLGAFLGRAFRGDWAGSVLAALWPVLFLLGSAVALAIPDYGQDEEDIVGFGDRMGIALASLLQGVGGGFEVSETGGGYSGELRTIEAGFTLTLVPLTVTLLFVVALYLGVRQVRTRLATRAGYAGFAGPGVGWTVPGGVTPGAPGAPGVLGTPGTPGAPGAPGRSAGLEAAVRVTLLVTVAVLLLGLFAQPTVALAEVSTSPWLAALGALVLTAAVSGGVLHRDDLAAWLAVRPGPRSLFRATGTAVRAMAIVLALCSLVALITLASSDELRADWEDDVNPLLIALFILPNIAVTFLGISWGASVEGEAGRSRYGDDSSYGDDSYGNGSYGGDSGDYGFGGSSPYGGFERESFGLSDLGDAVNDWAVVGALALGAVCALVLGVLAARRSSGRGEQLLAAGVFFGLFLLLAGISGFAMEASGSATSDFGGGLSAAGQVDVGLNFAEAMLFGLVWIFAAAFLAPYLVQMAGARTGVIAPPFPAMPSGPAAYGTMQGMPPVQSRPTPQGQPTPYSQTTPQNQPPQSQPTSQSYSPPQSQPTPYSQPTPQGQPTPQDQSAPQGQSATHPSQRVEPYEVPMVEIGHQLPAGPVAKPRGRALMWILTIAAAFVVGGGVAVAVLFLQK